MKKDALKTLRTKNIEELTSLYHQANDKLSHMRFDLRAGKTANIKDLRALKKEIAVILTLIKQQKTA